MGISDMQELLLPDNPEPLEADKSILAKNTTGFGFMTVIWLVASNGSKGDNHSIDFIWKIPM